MTNVAQNCRSEMSLRNVVYSVTTAFALSSALLYLRELLCEYQKTLLLLDKFLPTTTRQDFQPNLEKQSRSHVQEGVWEGVEGVENNLRRLKQKEDDNKNRSI